MFRQAGSLSLRELSTLRILFLSNDFPSPWLPTKGTFNFELARALGRQNDVQVVAPIPWVNELGEKRPSASSVWHDRVETRDGIRIQYPRYYYTPKFGRLWYDRFLWQSLRPTLQRQLAIPPRSCDWLLDASGWHRRSQVRPADWSSGIRHGGRLRRPGASSRVPAPKAIDLRDAARDRRSFSVSDDIRRT